MHIFLTNIWCRRSLLACTLSLSQAKTRIRASTRQRATSAGSTSLGSRCGTALTSVCRWPLAALGVVCQTRFLVWLSHASPFVRAPRARQSSPCRLPSSGPTAGTSFRCGPAAT